MKPGTGNGKGTEAICSVCGDKFIRNSKGQQTCGRSCAGRLAAIKQKDTITICVVCGKEMSAKGGRKTCGEQCKWIWDQKRRSESAKRNYELVRSLPKKGRRCRACGKLFDANSLSQANCSKRCARISATQLGALNPSVKDFEPVKIRIKKGLDVWPEMSPEVGRIYDAKKFTGQNGATYVIPEIGKHGLIVRKTECVEV